MSLKTRLARIAQTITPSNGRCRRCRMHFADSDWWARLSPNLPPIVAEHRNDRCPECGTLMVVRHAPEPNGGFSIHGCGNPRTFLGIGFGEL